MAKKKDQHQYIIVWEDEVTGEDVIVKFNTLNDAFDSLRAYKEENPDIIHSLYSKLVVTGLK